MGWPTEKGCEGGSRVHSLRMRTYARTSIGIRHITLFIIHIRRVLVAQYHSVAGRLLRFAIAGRIRRKEPGRQTTGTWHVDVGGRIPEALRRRPTMCPWEDWDGGETDADDECKYDELGRCWETSNCDCTSTTRGTVRTSRQMGLWIDRELKS